MIGVDGSYYFDAAIDEMKSKDFIIFDDQFLFEINEYAGNIIPDFKLIFTSHTDDLLPLLHEGTLIKARIGRFLNDAQNMTLYVTNWDSARVGENSRMYMMSGFAVPLEYACDYKYKIFSKKSAVAAILETAKATGYFQFDAENIATSNDSQIWIQPNMSDREFIQKTLYRSDLGDSFPVCAITLDRTFILKDLLKDAKRPYDWKLSNITDPKKKNEVPYFSDPAVTNNSGMINKIIGYGFDLKSLFLDAETAVTAKIEGKKVLSSNDKIAGLQGVQTKKMGGIQHTENVHPNYNKSFYHNVTQALNLSRVEIHVTIPTDYYAFKPLDRIQMFESALDNRNVAANYHSGLYYCTFVSRTIQNRMLATTMKLNRETLNKK